MLTNSGLTAYAVVDPDGIILRISTLEQGLLETLEAPPGESYKYPIPDGLDDLTHRWDEASGTWETLPPRPEHPHYWKGGAWKVYPEPPHHSAEFDHDLEVWVDPRTQEQLLLEFEKFRTDSVKRVSYIRGMARMPYITDLPGQDMLYIAKAEEAKAFLADSEPVVEDYPLIGSEVGTTAPTAYEVAQIFSNLNMLWRHAAGSIDAACFQAEAAVLQAPDRETINAILSALENALV